MGGGRRGKKAEEVEKKRMQTEERWPRVDGGARASGGSLAAVKERMAQGEVEGKSGEGKAGPLSSDHGRGEVEDNLCRPRREGGERGRESAEGIRA